MIIPITKLLVNPENPRFNPVKSQSDAVDLMLKEAGKKVLVLAKDIAQHGLNPSKSLMVVQEKNGMFMPLEGNRRVTALKLLHNPSQISNQKISEKFKELKKEFGSQIPNSVECVVFPDRESAFRWVNLEHTGSNDGIGVLGWNSLQQQRFAAQYAGKKPSRPVQLFDFADKHNLSRDSVDTTTIDRLLSNPFVREQIGISFPDGLLTLELKDSKVVSNLRKIFSEMSKSSFKVSEIYTSDKSKIWIKKVLGLNEKIKNEVSKSTDDPAHNQVSAKKITEDPLDGDWISDRLYSVYPKENRVKEMLKELKDLNPRLKPNVCAASLRVLLELSVYSFLKDNKWIEHIINLEKAKIAKENQKRKSARKLDPDWSPNFAYMLAFLSNDETIMPNPDERKAMKVFISKKSVEPFLAELNLFTHNPSYSPKESNVIEIWSKLGKLIFKAILNKQDANS